MLPLVRIRKKSAFETSLPLSYIICFLTYPIIMSFSFIPSPFFSPILCPSCSFLTPVSHSSHLNYFPILLFSISFLSSCSPFLFPLLHLIYCTSLLSLLLRLLYSLLCKPLKHSLSPSHSQSHLFTHFLLKHFHSTSLILLTYFQI